MARKVRREAGRQIGRKVRKGGRMERRKETSRVKDQEL